MSVETDPLPPAPEHSPPLKEDEGRNIPGRYFSQAWTRWFVSLRAKVNVINDMVANLSSIISSGIVVSDGSGNVSTVGRTDLVAGSNVNFTGSGIGRIIDDGSGPLTINSTGGGGGGENPTNPPWRHIVLQMPMTTNFANEAEIPWSPTANGGAVISGGVAVFNGTTAYVQVVGSNSVPMGVGLGDYCLDYFVTYNSFSSTPTVADPGSFADFANGSGTITIYSYPATGNLMTSSVSLSTGVEYHIRHSRVNGYFKLFINGVAVGNAMPSSQSGATATQFVIGRNGSGGGYFNGSVRGLRFARGWGSLENFTVPTFPLPTG